MMTRLMEPRYSLRITHRVSRAPLLVLIGVGAAAIVVGWTVAPLWVALAGKALVLMGLAGFAAEPFSRHGRPALADVPWDRVHRVEVRELSRGVQVLLYADDAIHEYAEWRMRPGWEEVRPALEERLGDRMRVALDRKR